MADQAGDEILQLAKQGNLQALSVYLNRHLIPHGAHVKLKNKEEALSILVVAMRESEDLELVRITQSLLTQLRPSRIQRVKVYSQVLGQKQAVLKQKFIISAAGEPDMSASKRSRPSGPKNTENTPPSAILASPATSGPELQSSSKRSRSAEQSDSASSSNSAGQNRYSVAEFLSQTASIKDLKILADHPFVTGVCPQCRHKFEDVDVVLVYWDCPQCGWKDNLSALVPRTKISANSAQTSLVESKRLGDYLIEAGLLTDSQIEIALADQMNTGLRFGEVLTRRGWVKEETIEYLMKKVIIPERSGQDQNAPAFLASSRNLLKALIQEQAEPAQILPSKSFTAGPGHKQPANLNAAQPVPSAPVGKLPNERETLILPDLDMDEYLKDA